VAQVGRISGPLLEANLLRNGVDLAFRNDLSTQQLLYLDVSTQRIGVNTNTPSHDLQTLGTTRTTDLIVDDTANIDGVWTIQTDTITLATGDIKLKASNAIRVSNLETDVFSIRDNFIKTNDSNANIELVTNGTGTVEILGSGLEIKGNLYTSGNITFDGDIYFGNTGDDSTALADTVEFNSDIDSNIVPDIDDTYDLGSAEKYWSEIETTTAHGQLSNMQQLSVSNINLNLTHGNVFYVAENGDDAYKGDHLQEPLATIQEAIARADSSAGGQVTIYISAGIYEEQLPLEIPDRVSIVGSSIRNTIIKPAAGSESKDVFHLGESAIVANVTVSDFFYDNINDTGYAFRFKQDAVVAERSPYVQNVTVITKGSVVTADDPRGFAEGDAGKGALIDKDELNSSTVEGSMLFHSCTFITPGVNAITMTNGVRVEWLNSFTYFADRGLYLTNGSTGNGAELRSIGSANVYGNYGVVADGNNTLAYLIQHNMAYIGVGKFVDNDSSRAIQSNETVELNSGVINYVTTDHTGSFRIGDNFLVDFETGGTSLDTSAVTLDTLDTLRIQDGAGNETLIVPSAIDIGNLQLTANTFSSVAGEINIDPVNEINFDSNVNLDGNLDITGDLSYDGVLNLAGDQPTDTVTFNVNIQQDFNPNTDSKFNLGSLSKEWTNIWLSKANIGDINIFDNIIDTTITNAFLELRANGTGEILISSNNLNVTNDFTVSGFTTLDETSVEGSLTLFGDLNHTGNFTVTQDTIVEQNLIVDAAARFEEILINNNVITTTSSNANLELNANGTGIVNLQETVEVLNNLSSRDTAANNTNITLNITTDNANIDNVEINDNTIITTSGDLILEATGNVIIDTNNVLVENSTLTSSLTVDGSTTLQPTYITGTLNHTGNNIKTVGNLNLLGELTVDNVYIEDNFITTTSGNLSLGATGDINVDTNNVEIAQDLTVSGDTTLGSETVVPSTTEILPSSITSTASFAGFEFQPGTDYRQSVSVLYIDTADWDISRETFPQYLKGTNTVNGDYFLIEIDNPAPGAPGQYQYDVITKISSTSPTVIINQSDVFDFVLGTALDEDVIINPVDVSITGTLTQTGDRTQTGNLDIAGEITNGNILIEDNFISTTSTNSDLELRANGTGEVVIDPTDSLTIENNLFVGGTLDYQGSLTINGNVVLLGNVQDGSLTVTENFDVTGALDISSQAQFEDVRIEDNFVTTTQSNSNLELRAAGTGEVLIPNNNVQVNNNLFTASISTGDVTVNNDLVLDELVITDSNIEINENYITTKISNADLELRATGNVVVQENTILSQDLTVNTDTNLQSTNINGTLTHAGDRTQTGDYTLTGNLNLSSLVTDQEFQFDDIRISGNVLETTLSNSNLDLRASGTGEVLFNENVQMGQDLTIGSLNVGAISVDTDVAFEEIELSTDIQFEDNYITTTNSNSDLELRAAGSGKVFLQELDFKQNTIGVVGSGVDSTLLNITLAPSEDLVVNSTSALTLPIGDSLDRKNVVGDIRFNNFDNIFEGTGTTGNTVSLDGVYSSNRLTSVTADPTSNNIRFVINGAASLLDSSNLVGEVTGEGLTIHGLQVDDILLDNNTITTNVSNSDLDLAANGTGELVLDNLSLKDNVIKDNQNNLIIKHTRFGHAKVAGTFGVVIPSGTTVTPIPDPQIGDTRWNTINNVLETWNGTQYVVATGTQAAISQSEFDDLLLEYTIIFG